MKAFRYRVVLLLILVLCPLLGHGASKNDLQQLKINFRYNVLQEDRKNFLSWTINGSKGKDYFDVQSGASEARSTQMLASVSTVSKNKVLPKGLRALLLFAVSPRQAALDDALSVNQDGKELTIQFVHRGIAYRIQSDKRSRLNVDSSFFFAENIAKNSGGSFTLIREALPGGKETVPATEEKPREGSAAGAEAEQLQQEERADMAQSKSFEPAPFPGDATDMHNVVWENLNFIPDTASEKALKLYSGSLKASYRKGILRITGTLIPIEKTTGAE